jgi:hypothetical protein
MNFRHLIKFLIGVLFSACLIGLGLFLTNLSENGFWLAFAVLSIPAFGFYLYKSNRKHIGLGMLISTIPIIIIGLLFIIISGLH